MRKYRTKRERALYKTAAKKVVDKPSNRPVPNKGYPSPHIARREGDEMFCRCGLRWDVGEDDPHSSLIYCI